MFTTQPSIRNEVVFVFDDLPDWQTLAASAGDSGYEVAVFPGSHDGLALIAEYLQGRAHIAALHLLSHGSHGCVYFGSTRLKADITPYHADLLRSIGRTLAEDGDVLLYGCHTG